MSRKKSHLDEIRAQHAASLNSFKKPEKKMVMIIADDLKDRMAPTPEQRHAITDLYQEVKNANRS